MTEAQVKLYRSAVESFKQQFGEAFVSILHNAIPNFVQPEDLRTLREQIERLHSCLTTISAAQVTESQGLGPVYPELWPLLKRVLLVWRRGKTEEYERFKDTTINPEVLQSFDSKIAEIDQVLNIPSLRDVDPTRLPMLVDYLPIQKIESLPQFQHSMRERAYDEKFHILQAPDLFSTDFAFYRTRCELRAKSLIIAFLDIDNFKALNTEFGHDSVDRYVLPFFMRSLEASVYNHGFAYRFGGDEYMVLLPNFSRDIGIAFLEELRLKIGDLKYQISTRTTVSIGMCCVSNDCSLTDRELTERAGKAMQYAKGKGRDRVATFNSPSYLDEDLTIVNTVERVASTQI
jgi:diguanylate cyclase (GGDEF)-like protein